MSWVRLDDGFATHPKVAVLSDRAFRVHVRALCYCALHRTHGALPPLREIPGANESARTQLLAVGVWEMDDAGRLLIHDFDEFNGKASEREAARLRKREQRQRAKAVANA